MGEKRDMLGDERLTARQLGECDEDFVSLRDFMMAEPESGNLQLIEGPETEPVHEANGTDVEGGVVNLYLPYGLDLGPYTWISHLHVGESDIVHRDGDPTCLFEFRRIDGQTVTVVRLDYHEYTKQGERMARLIEGMLNR